MLCFTQLLGCVTQTENTQGFVTGAGGLAIAYEATGAGKVGLIFVHGWACDRSYWRKQVSMFSENYRVIAVDLGGHGDSSNERDDWSMQSFGQDVAAVAAEIDVESIILIGHSMGGPVVLEAATQIGDRVVAVVGIDTLKNVGSEPLTQRKAKSAFNTTAAEFPTQTEAFVRRAFFIEDSPAELVDEIAADMAKGDPGVAAASVVGLMTYDVRAALDSLQDTPLLLINSDYTATDVEALKAAHPNSRVSVIPETGHFVMLEKPLVFNAVLNNEVHRIVHGQ